MINNKYFYTIINMALFLQSINSMVTSILLNSSNNKAKSDNIAVLNNIAAINLDDVKGSIGLFPHQITYDEDKYNKDEQYRKEIIQYTGNLVKKIDIEDFPKFFEIFTEKYIDKNRFLMEIVYIAGAQKIRIESANIKKNLNENKLDNIYKSIKKLEGKSEYDNPRDYMLNIISSELLENKYLPAPMDSVKTHDYQIKKYFLELMLNNNIGADKVFNRKEKVLELLSFLPQKN